MWGGILIFPNRRKLVTACFPSLGDGDNLRVGVGRAGNMIYLTIDNPEAREDFVIHARDIKWYLRVVKLHVDL